MIEALRRLRKILCNSCYLLRVQKLFFFVFIQSTDIYRRMRVMVHPHRTCRPDDRSVWLPLCSRRICCHVFTCVLFRGQCAGGCAIAGWREWREMRERRGQESRWVSRREGLCQPTRHRFCRAPSLSHCSIVTDASGTQRGSGCRHRHECDRKGTPLLLCFEGTHRVAQWRAQNLLAESAHDTGHWPRSVCVVEDSAVEFLLLSCGRKFEFLLVPTQADGCTMTPQRGSCFHHGGATSAELRIGNMNGECNKKGNVMAIFCAVRIAKIFHKKIYAYIHIYFPCAGSLP
ncbi:hypothetical protein TcCL_NonESM06620 [Trypanosoma cruzi]|nr:hypothetical protein TcCL_NonESM06620 [Trypanosoma cruzi]